MCAAIQPMGSGCFSWTDAISFRFQWRLRDTNSTCISVRALQQHRVVQVPQRVTDSPQRENDWTGWQRGCLGQNPVRNNVRVWWWGAILDEEVFHFLERWWEQRLWDRVLCCLSGIRSSCAMVVVLGFLFFLHRASSFKNNHDGQFAKLQNGFDKKYAWRESLKHPRHLNLRRQFPAFPRPSLRHRSAGWQTRIPAQTRTSPWRSAAGPSGC